MLNVEAQIQIFEEIVAKFAERHPALSDFLPLYVLTNLAIEWDLENNFLWLAVIEHGGYGGLFSPALFQSVRGSMPTDIKSMNPEVFRAVCEHFIRICVEMAAGLSALPSRILRNPWGVIDIIESIQPGIVQRKESHTGKSFVEVITAEMGRNVFSFSRSSTNFEIDLDKLSDEGFQMLAVLTIVESVWANRESHFPDARVVELIRDYAQIKTGEDVYNPNCGVAALMVELGRGLDGVVSFRGECANDFEYIIASANILASGLDATIFNESDLSQSKELENFFSGPDADVAVSILPHRARIASGQLDRELFPVGSRTGRSEDAYVELMLAVLKPLGRAVFFVSDHFLNSPQAKPLRQHLVETDLLERVHYLPRNRAANRALNGAIVVLDKAKARPNTFMFGGDDSSLEEVEVTKDQIADKRYSWHPRRFALRDRAIVDELLKHSLAPIHRVGDLVDTITTGRGVSIGTGDGTPYDRAEVLPLVSVSNLLQADRGNDFEPFKSADRWTLLENSRRNIIRHTCVLVTTLGHRLKPTLFEFREEPIAIGPGVIALKPSEGIREDYLLAQLQSRLVEVQAAMFASGNVLPRLSRNDLLDILIPLPSLDEQKRISIELLAVTAERAGALETVEEVREEIRETEYDVIAAISHNLNQKLGSVVEDTDSLLRYLKRQARAGHFEFEAPLRPPRIGETIDRVETFSDVAERLQRNLSETTSALKRTESILQKRSLTLERTNVVKFFKEEILLNFESARLKTSLDTARKRIDAALDRPAFKDAIWNLVDNARRHGFTDSERTYQIVFSLDVIEDELGEKWVQIIYKNNGDPFPEGFSFDQYRRLAARSGKTKGSGIGGFFVSRVIDLHGGQFNSLSTARQSSTRFPVQFEILLPYIGEKNR